MLAKRVCSVSNSSIRINVGLIMGTPHPSPPTCLVAKERTVDNKNATAANVVNAVRIEIDQGLRRRDWRARRPSGEGASRGSRGEPNGIVLVSLDGWDDGVRQRLEFRERGFEEPLSRRRSKLVPCLAICDRDLSFGSMAWPWSSGDRVGESSVSSSTGEPEERLCIGGGGVGIHPAHKDLGTGPRRTQ